MPSVGFVGWARTDTNMNYVSNRTRLTDDMINENASVTRYVAQWSYDSKTYRLHYMMESLDGTGNLNLADYRDNTRYKEDMSKRQDIDSENGNWSIPDVDGYQNTYQAKRYQCIFNEEQYYGYDYNRNGRLDVYFYYIRNREVITLYNYNQTLATRNAPFGDTLVNAYNKFTSYQKNPPRPLGINEHYEFQGWYFNQDCNDADTSNDIKFDPNTDKTVIQKNGIILYARWAIPQHKVTFEPDNGEQNTVKYVDDGQVLLTPSDPKKEGFVFAGWYDENDRKFIFGTKVTEDITLHAKWLPLKYVDYTVKYVDEDGNELLKPTTQSVIAGTDVLETAKEISGYFPDQRYKHIYKISDTTNNTITFVYSKIDQDVYYRVKYVDIDTGKELKPAKVEHGEFTRVIENAPTIDGYDAISESQSIILGQEFSEAEIKNNEIVFYYKKQPVPRHTIHIKYEFNKPSDETEKLKPMDYYVELEEGENFVVPTPSIEGYHPNHSEISGTVGSENQEYVVTYYDNEYELRIRYHFDRPDHADGVTLPADHVENLIKGDYYDVPTPEIDGYTPDIKVVEGTMNRENKIIDVTYHENKYKLDIEYQFEHPSEELNKLLPDSYHGEYYKDDTYKIPSPEIDGYVPNVSVVEGTMGKGNKKIVVTYSEKKYSLDIDYVFDEVNDKTNALKPAPVHKELEYGKDYNEVSPTIKGYKADHDVIGGKMPSEDVHYTVTYTANDYPLTINFKYVDGHNGDTSKLPQTIKENVKFNHDYHHEVPSITGYDSNYSVIDGTMDEEGKTITVIYTPKKYDLTVKYVDENGNKLKEPTTQKVAYLDDYEVSAPEIEGYEAKKDKVSGTMDSEGKEETITYVPKTYQLTIHYKYKEDDKKAAEDKVISVPYKDTYNEKSPEIDGFTCETPVVKGNMPASNKEITVYYTRNDYTVNVDYVFAEGGTAHPSVSETHGFDKDYNIVSPTIEGYKPDKESVSGKMPSHNINETVTYTKQKYQLTINYKYENGDTAAKSVSKEVYYNDLYTQTSPTIEGFTADPLIVSGNMPAHDQVIDVVYHRNSYQLNIKYQYEDGREAHTTYSESIPFDKAYDITSPTIKGYTPTPATVSGKMPSHDVSATVIYKKNKHNVVVEYKYEDGREAHATVTNEYEYQDKYDIKSPEIEGYHPDVETVSGTMDDADIHKVVTYSKNDYNLNVKFQYEGGKKAFDDVNKTVKFDEDYTVDVPTLEGYTPTPATVSGKMPASDKEVIVVYKKNSYNLNINYVYEETGEKAAEPYTEKVLYQDKYSHKSPTIEGYHPSVEVVEGTMGSKDVNITVKYSKNSHNLTIKYQFENGSEAATTHSESLKYNDDYKVKSPTVKGYTPQEEYVSGTMKDEDIEKVVVYKQNKHHLVIDYVYEDKSVAEPQYDKIYGYGDSYNIETPEKDGYTPTIETVTGKMEDEDKHVTVVYEKNSYKVKVNYEYAENGKQAADSKEETVKYNEKYSIDSPVIKGFTADEKTISGVMGTENVEKTVIYTRNKHNLTVNYKYENGDEAHTPNKSVVEYDKDYNVTSPTIVGYTPTRKVVSGTMDDSDKTEEVIYKRNSHKLIIDYVYENGDTASESVTKDVLFNDDYSVKSPEIEGYHPDIETVSGTMADEDKHIRVVYSKNSYKVKVNYIYSDTKETAKPSVEETHKYKEDYSISSPEIEGYTASKKVVSGTMGSSDVEETVEYSKNKYDLTINYEFSDGTKASEPHTEKVLFNDKYEVTSPEIHGYTADKKAVSGTMPASNVSEKVVYTKNKHNLVIDYVYEDGTEAHTQYSGEYEYKDNYSIASPTIHGYTASETTVSGVMDDANIHKKVVYSKNTYKVKVNYVYDEDGSKASDPKEVNVKFNEKYSIDSPEIEGFTPSRVSVDGTMPASNVEETVRYTRNSYTLTVKYQYEDGKEAKPDHIEKVLYDKNYSVKSPIINGYSASQEIVSGTMGSSDVEVIVVYHKNPYKLTINYVDEEGNLVAVKHSENVLYNESYSVDSPKVVGYTPDQATVSGTMPAENKVINVVYRKNVHSIKVNYIYEENGKEAAPSVTKNVAYGDEYDIDSPIISGFTPNKAEIKGTMADKNIEVTVKYTRNSHTLNIDYVYADNGNKAATSHTETVEFDKSYSVTSPEIHGYTASDSVVSGTMGDNDINKVVKYTKNSHKLIIDYVDENGNKLSPSVEKNLLYDESYNVNSPKVDGYSTTMTKVSGVMDDADIHKIVKYTKNTYKVTVKYVYEDGSEASPTVTNNVKYQESYKIDSPEIKGYHASQTEVSGVMGTNNVEVTVTYSKNKYSLVIDYVYEDGSKAKDSITQNIDYNDNYNVKSPTIKGYTPDKVIVKGVMSAQGVHEKVIYKPNEHTVNVKYVDENGKELAKAVHLKKKYKENYSIKSPIVTGYTARTLSVSGTMDDEDVDKVVVYTKNTYKLTVKYVYEDGSEAAKTVSKDVDYQDTYSITSPSIKGYSADKKVVSGTMGSDNVEVVVRYTKNEHQVIVDYVYEDGSKAKDSITQNVSYKDSYKIDSPLIEGYSADKKVVSGVMDDEDVHEKVVYSKNKHHLVIDLVDDKGNKLQNSIDKVLSYNDKYNEKVPTIEGYTPKVSTVSGVMKDKDVHEKVVYEKNTYKVTVKYIYEDGKEASPTVTNNVKYQEAYKIDSPLIKGYTANKKVVSGTMGSKNVEVTVEYSKNKHQVVVDYVYEDGKEAKPSVTKALNYQDTYQITSPVIKGYTANKKVVSGTMGDEDIKEVVTYKPNKYTVTIDYVDEDGNKLKDSVVKEVEYNKDYSITSPEVEGYKPDIEKVSGTMEDSNVHKKVVYQKQTYALTIHYVKRGRDANTPVPGSVTHKYKYNESYRVVSPKLQGYTCTQPIVQGVMPASNKEVYVYYDKTPVYTIKFIHVDEDGNVIGGANHEHTQECLKGMGFDTPIHDIPGYTFDKVKVDDKTPATVSVRGNEIIGSDVEHDVTIYTVYKANKNPLDITYKYENGKEASNPYHEDVEFNKNYKVDSPVIKGYTADKKVVSGTMDADGEKVVVTYKKNKYNVTVDLVDEDGNPIKAPIKTQVAYDDKFEISVPKIEGYTPSVEKVKGTMEDNDQHYQVVYKKNKYTVNIKYVDENGKELKPSNKVEGYYKDQYSINSPEIKGYIADKEVVKGTLDKDEDIVVTYKKQQYTLTVNYVINNSDGKVKVPGTITKTLSYNDAYHIESPKLNGYKCDKPLVEGVMPAENKTITVYYDKLAMHTIKFIHVDENGNKLPVSNQEHSKLVEDGSSFTTNIHNFDGYTFNHIDIKSEGSVNISNNSSVISANNIKANAIVYVVYNTNKYSLTINYVDEDGKEISKPYIGNVKYNDKYSVNSPKVNGYTPTYSVVKGVMGDSNKTITVVYKKDVVKHKLTINYVDSKGNKISSSYVNEIAENTKYSVDSPKIKGYICERNVITGTMGKSDVVETIVYKKINKATIEYVDDKGNVIGKEVVDVVEGNSVNVVSPKYDGYTSSKDSVTITGNGSDQVVRVTYNKNKKVTHKLTIKYEDADGKKVSEDYVVDLVANDKYHVASPKIEGYTANTYLVEGVMGDNDVVITVKYKKLPKEVKPKVIESKPKSIPVKTNDQSKKPIKQYRKEDKIEVKKEVVDTNDSSNSTGMLAGLMASILVFLKRKRTIE